MKKTLVAILYAAMLITTAVCLAGCDSQQSALQGVEKATIPSEGYGIYGISYAVPDTQWTYMFNADQLGNGDELIDLDISGGEAEKGLKAYWEEACEAKEFNEDSYVLKDSGEETIDGKECYWYDKYDDGKGETVSFWCKVLLIPQSDENKYVEIRSDFIEEANKEKADKFFRELLEGIEFVDSKAYIVNKDYICAGGACISAKGLKPTQLFYGLMDWDDTEGLVSVQIDFSSEDYKGGRDEGPLEIDGVEGRWQKVIDRLEGSMTYLGYYVTLPVDEIQENITIAYNFNGDVEDLSQYDDQIKELTEQLHITKAK